MHIYCVDINEEELNRLPITSITLLDIRDADGYESIENDIQDLITSGNIMDILPDGYKHINSGVFSLERLKGYWVEMSSIQERVDIEMFQHTILYQLDFRGKKIGLSCNTGRLKEEKKIADEIYREIKPLCRQILNSIVLLKAY